MVLRRFRILRSSSGILHSSVAAQLKIERVVLFQLLISVVKVTMLSYKIRNKMATHRLDRFPLVRASSCTLSRMRRSADNESNRYKSGRSATRTRSERSSRVPQFCLSLCHLALSAFPPKIEEVVPCQGTLAKAARLCLAHSPLLVFRSAVRGSMKVESVHCSI